MSRAVDGLVVDPGAGGETPGGLRKLLPADQPLGVLAFAEVNKSRFPDWTRFVVFN